MNCGRAAWLLPIGCLLLVQALVPIVAADGLTGRLETQDKAFLEGTTTVQTHGGVVHMPAGWALANTASIDTVVVNTTWKQAYQVQARPVPERPNPDVVSDNGHDKHWFNGSTLTIEPFQEPADVILTKRGTPYLAASASGTSIATTSHDDQLVRIGFSKNATEAGETQRVGFSYAIEGPWSSVQSLDRVEIQGNFTLFVHNATLTVTTPEGDTWTNWTGYKEDRSPGPSPVPTPEGTAAEFELRVTQLHVTNGTFVFEAPGAVDVYAPELAPHLNGTVSGQAASGQLEALSTLFAYDKDPFELDGEGTVHLSPVLGGPSSSDGQSTDAVPGLALEPSGAFAVVETEGVERQRVPTANDAGTSLGNSEMVATLGLLVAVGGVAVLGWRRRSGESETEETWTAASVGSPIAIGAGQPPPINHPLVHALPPGDGYEAQLDAATKLRKDHELARAQQAFQAIGHRYPGTPVPWHQLALVSIELGHYDHALKALVELDRIVGPDEPDVLALRVRTLWAAGRQTEATKSLAALAELAPKRAARMVVNQGMVDLVLRVPDQLPPHMLVCWAKRAWRLGQQESARSALTQLIEQDPNTARATLLDPDMEQLARMVVGELSPAHLETLVKEAWHADRLGLARVGFYDLAQRAPARALGLSEQAVYEPLRNDMRADSILSRFERACRDPNRADDGRPAR